MKKLSEKEMLVFQQGDRNAFALVFEAYFTPLVNFAKNLTGSQDEAEDIVTEGFVVLLQRVQLYRTEEGIKAFLYVTVRNRCLNYLKAKKTENDRRQQFASYIRHDMLLKYEYDTKNALVEALQQAIGELPGECRKIFQLLYYERLKPAEVAERLQLSVNTVYVQKSRAMQALRASLLNIKNR